MWIFIQACIAIAIILIYWDDGIGSLVKAVFGVGLFLLCASGMFIFGALIFIKIFGH